MIGAFLVAFAAVAQGQQVGYVLNLRGEWVLNSSQKLKAGDPVPAEGTIQLVRRVTGEFIEILDNGGRRINAASANCDIVRCDHPFKLPPVVQRNILRKLVDSAMEIFRDYPDLRKPLAISRGTELREAVVKIENERIDLTSVFANLSRGKLLVRFESARLDAPRDTKFIGPINVDWDPTQRAIVFVKGLSPGLYIVRPLSNADREPLEQGSESLVSVDTPTQYEKDIRLFNEGVKLTNSWGRSIRHESKRKFLRAVLASLEGSVKR